VTRVNVALVNPWFPRVLARVNPWFPRVPPPSGSRNPRPKLGSRRAKPAFAGIGLVSAAMSIVAMVGVAAAAPAPVAPELRGVVSPLRAKTSVPVLLPSYFPYARSSGQKLRAAGSAQRSRWSVSLYYGRNCGGANACTVGFMEGQRRGTPGGFVQRVTLAQGVKATYKPTTCGASCSPAEIDWVLKGVVYRYQLQVNARGKAAEKAAMIKMANSAIKAGPR